MRRRARRQQQAWEQAVGAYGIESEPRIRPNPLRWLLYVIWVPLPDRHRLWVLYDATCSTWVFRYLLRLLLLTAVPTTLLIVLLPGPIGLRLLISLTTGGVAFLLTAAWVNEGTEHRLAQADWPWQFGPTIRQLRADLADSLR